MLVPQGLSIERSLGFNLIELGPQLANQGIGAKGRGHIGFIGTQSQALFEAADLGCNTLDLQPQLPLLFPAAGDCPHQIAVLSR